MALNPDIRDQAYRFFVEEAQELLQVLEAGLLDLHQDHSIPKIHELMRAAHSIKGGAASVELSGISLLAHRLEDFLRALYSDDVDLDSELEGLLLQGYDCLAHPLLEQIEVGSFDETAALLQAEPVFAALENRLAEALKNADNYLPSSSDLGVDVVASIFEVDVAQALERLQAVSLHPENYDPAAELRGTLEMFAGFAELFNLSGFSEIVQSAQAALELNPQAVLAIIKFTMADCSQAIEQVLAGDRERGGTVSLALREIAQNKLATTDIQPDQTELTLLAADSLLSQLPLDNDLDDFSQLFTMAVEATIEAPVNDDYHNITEEEISAETSNNFDNLWSNIAADESAQEFSAEDTFGTIFDAANTLEVKQDLTLETAIDDLDDLAQASSQTTTSQSSQTEIAEGIDLIANIFDSLPKAQFDALLLSPESTSPPKTSGVEPKAKTVAKNSANSAPKLSVRVDLDRLERMNNLVGELTINRNSLALQNEQLQENVLKLEHKFLRFHGVIKQLREISDQMMLEARTRSSLNLPQNSPHNINNLDSVTDIEFDTLELDSYSLLYSSLQEMLEEMVQLEEGVEDITIFAQQADRTIDNQRQMLGQMRDELMWVRMLPLEQILQRFPRILRDLSSKYQKPVDLKLKGTGVLVDKAVLEKLFDPLLHLLRNGFDHGIETTEQRTQQGKAAMGSIEIQAYYQGNQTVIEVKDDGQGLDLARITQKGIEQGLILPQEAATASPERLFELIFEPGFSTAQQVSEISGRGVGMNIVRSQVEILKGKISVTSISGQGTTFTLRLPLTLTIAKLLVCSLGSTAFAIPSDSIEEIIIPAKEQLKVANGQQFLFFKGKLVPIYSLPAVLTYNCPIPDTESHSKAFKTIAPPEDWAAPLLLLRRGQQLFALEVVSLLSEQELVIKPYGKAIAPPPYSYGCTILGDGSLIPAFDGSALIGMILGEAPPSTITWGYSSELDIASKSEKIDQGMNLTVPEQQLTPLKTIMIVDDSTALRRTMALTLEKEGYRVVQKKDGKEALNGFKQHPELDLIICDVEMPVMNGFEFLGMRRQDSALAQVPTFMLTSRSGAKHRNLAKQLGADGYFTKPYVEQDFIQAVKKILGNKQYPKDKTGTVIPSKNKTILIIDDSSALRSTLALSLEQQGYRVLQGRDGKEGLEQLRNNLGTDLVICDIEMPNLDGFEFLTLCRQETSLSQIPVVMLSSRGTEKHRALAASLGAIGFFTKPYVEQQFIAQIAQYIRP